MPGIPSNIELKESEIHTTAIIEDITASAEEWSRYVKKGKSIVKPTIPFIPGSNPSNNPRKSPSSKNEKCCTEKIVCKAEMTDSSIINKRERQFPVSLTPLIETLAAFSLRVSL